MKQFPEIARRAVSLALAASMSLSVFMPGALAANVTTAEEHDHDHDHVHLAAENSVDALGNEDLSDEMDTVPDETADAADHTWGEWTEGEDEDGQPVELRICEDCGAVELEDGTIIGYINMGDEPELADDDQPEWYPSDFIAPLGMDDSDYALATQGLNPDGETWNYGADYSKWVYNKSTQYKHGYDGLGYEHKGGLNTQTSVSNGKNKAVTCKESGYIGHNCKLYTGKGWYKIKVCESEWHETIPTPGKHLKNLYEVKATCTKPGVKYYYCGRDNGVNGGNGDICYYIWDDPAPVITSATGHLSSNGEYWFPDDETTEDKGWHTQVATCGEDGKLYRDCKNCDAKEVKETYPATGNHTPFADLTSADSWHILKKATCTEDGKRIQKCSVCGHDIPGTEEVIPKLGHTYDKEVAALKPCQSGTFTCTRCDDVKLVEATADHDWKKTSSTQPFLCKPGEDTFTCEACGATKTETSQIKPHTPSEWDVTVKPTCTEPGTKIQTCTVCGETLHTETIPATDHHTGGTTDEFKWTVGDGTDVGWVVNQPHKCVDGTKTRTCDARRCNRDSACESIGRS